MSYLYDLCRNGYGEPTMDMPKLKNNAMLEAIEGILWLDSMCGQEYEARFTPQYRVRRLLHDLLGDVWDNYGCYVVVYEENEAYGGPEEGGWWYLEGRTQYVTKINGDDWRQILTNATAMRDRLNKAMKADQATRGGITSFPWRSASIELHPQLENDNQLVGYADIRRTGRPYYC